MEESRQEYEREKALDRAMQDHYDEVQAIIKKTLHADSILDSFMLLLEESLNEESTHATHLCSKLKLNKKQMASLLDNREEMKDLLNE